MCGPLAIAGAAVAAGAVIKAGAEKKAGDYNAAVGKQNAALSEEAAQDAEARGAAAATHYRSQVHQFLGTQRATIAANGIEASGTALDVMADSATQGEMDALTIRNNAAREAFGYRVRGFNALAQSQLDKMSGQMNAAGTLLGGAGQVAGMFA